MAGVTTVSSPRHAGVTEVSAPVATLQNPVISGEKAGSEDIACDGAVSVFHAPELPGLEKEIAAETPGVDGAVPGAQGEPGTLGDLAAAETRVANDGNAYSLVEFVEHYGEERGAWMWEVAAEPMAAEEAAVEMQAHVPAIPAVPTLDEGLQAAFDSLAADLRDRVVAFAQEHRAGSRLKLPTGLTARQRKALHLWAEANGLHHKSFGWAKKRRLHLAVGGDMEAGDAGKPGEAEREEEFNWGAWAEEEKSGDEFDSEGENGGNW